MQQWLTTVQYLIAKVCIMPSESHQEGPLFNLKFDQTDALQKDVFKRQSQTVKGYLRVMCLRTDITKNT